MPEDWVKIYSNQKEIEFVNLTFQLILEPVLKPALPSQALQGSAVHVFLV